MLSFLGFSMVAVFMYLIMSKRLTPLVALMLIPILFGLIAGDANEMGTMMAIMGSGYVLYIRKNRTQEAWNYRY